MGKYRLLAGSHVGLDGELLQVGAVVSSESDLVAVFGANKFEKVHGQAGIQPQTAPAEPDEIPLPEGELVDDKFDYSPEETGLHVFKVKEGTKTRYNVTDVDDLSTPLNAEPLTRAKVLPFIESECEGDGEEDGEDGGD